MHEKRGLRKFVARLRRSLVVIAVALVAIVALLTSATANAASCGGAAYAPPGGGWGAPSQANVGFIGSPGYRKSYTWQVQGNFKTLVAAQGRGFDSSGRSQWYDVGISSDGGSGSVPWGNILAYPQFRVRSGSGNGVQVTWQC
jgi:hypothetical protein